MTARRRRFKVSDLVRLGSGEDLQDDREPEISVGSLVRLNSGGPVMLVVDTVDGVTAAWRLRSGKIEEHTFPRICVHRARDAW